MFQLTQRLKQERLDENNIMSNLMQDDLVMIVFLLLEIQHILGSCCGSDPNIGACSVNSVKHNVGGN